MQACLENEDCYAFSWTTENWNIASYPHPKRCHLKAVSSADPQSKANVVAGLKENCRYSPCTPSSPCDLTQGDCDSHYDCKGFLQCGADNCKQMNPGLLDSFADSDDCCDYPPCIGGDSCCTSSNPCGKGEGDCDYDNDCIGSLACGTDNCQLMNPDFADKFDPTDDCCA